MSMNAQTYNDMFINLYPYILMASSFISSAIAYYSYKYYRIQRSTATKYYFLLVLAVFYWCIAGSIESFASNYEIKIIITKLMYMGIAFIPVFWFIFSAHFSRSAWINKRIIRYLLFLAPIITVILVITSHLHSLVWKEILLVNYGARGIVLEYVSGIWNQIYGVYSYLLLILGTLLLLKKQMSKKYYIYQSFILIFGSMIPLVFNILYILELTPIKGLDYTAVSLALCGALLGYSFFRYDLLKLWPVALDSLFTNLQDGILVVDSNNHIVAINPKLVSFIGIQQDNIGQDLKSIQLNEISEKLIPKIINNESCRFELDTLENDNSKYYSVNVNPVYNLKKDVTAKVVTFHDITELKQSEAVLIASEERYRSVVQSQSELICRALPDTTISFVNDSYCKTFNVNKKELIGRKWINYVPISDRKKITESIKGLSPDNPSSVYEEKALLHNGEVMWCEWYDHAFFDDNGNITEIQSVGRDITERKKNEERIEYLSYHDVMTGIFNRAYFDESIHRIDSQENLPISIIMADLNGLKLVNDAFGHAVGDKLLIDAAKIFSELFREQDIVSRIGGDEFVIIMPKSEISIAEGIVNSIKDRCQKNIYAGIELSISFGWAVKTNMEEKIEEVLCLAENNMYHSKMLENNSVRSSMLLSLKEVLIERTHETEEHCQRIKDVSVRLGKKLGLSEGQIKDLEILSLLHDIGKTAISDRILLKPGKLTDEEWAIMKKHPELGCRIISTMPELITIAEAVLCHHENWNGTGYPKQLKGEEIPLLARIISVADAFDAMTNDRPYHKAMSTEEAIEELKRCSGTQFDPYMVDVFVRVLDE